MAEVVFKRMGVPSLTMTPQAVCAIHACGATTGLVLDMGLLEAMSTALAAQTSRASNPNPTV